MVLAAKGAPVTARESLFWPTTGTCTVAVTNAAGSTVASGLSATYDSSTTEWAVTLTHTHTATPGLLTVSWTHSTGATHSSRVDVRAGNPFPLSTLNKVLARGSGTYTDADKQRALEAAVIDLEDKCGVALVSQRSTATLAGSGTVFVTDWHNITAIVSVPAGTTASDVEYTDAGVLTFPATVTDPTVTVDHGPPQLAPDAARAVALLASSRIIDGPWDDRGMALSSEGGVMRLMTAGSGASHYSIPEVQEFYRSNRRLVIR